MKRSPYKDATRTRAKYFPRDRVAVIYGKKRITWRELNQRIDRLGNALRDLGIKKGDKCALLFHNTPEFMETNLAIQGLGAIPVPVNYHYVERELEYVLDNSDAVCLIFEADALGMVQGLKARLKKVKSFICKGDGLPEGILSYEGLISTHPDRDLKAEIDLDDIAVIIYTGGTTGFPKGVMLTYRNMQSNQEALSSYLMCLLPPVEEMELKIYAKNEFQRRLLDTLSGTLASVKSLFSEPDLADKVVVLELKPSGGFSIPPIAVTTREGRMKAFSGMPSKYDLLIQVSLGEEFREFSELSIYPYTLKGKLALIPKLLKRALSGSTKIEGAAELRSKLLKLNFRTPKDEEPVNMLALPPLFHLASYAMWLGFWILQKGSMVLTGSPSFDPKEVLELIENEKVTSVFMVPAMWKRFLEYPDMERFDLSSVKVALTGAALLLAKYKKRMLGVFPNALILDAFGQTEMAPVATIKVDGEASEVKDRSVGKLLSGIELRIVNDKGEDAKDGEVGELWYRGASVMKGYYRDEEKSRQVIDAEGWFRSGDLAYRGEDGEIYTVERKGECINTGGEKVFPLEVEEIIQKHPQVADICVIGVPDEDWGEAVRAVIVLKKGAEVTEAEIIEWCKGQMASFKKPKSIVFAQSLPLSPVGKIQRAQVKKSYGKTS